MTKLKKLTLRGFASIKDTTLEFRALNVMIGSNGAGKSNLVSFFKMLNEIMGGRLQAFIAASGHAQGLLHYGPKVTPQLEASLEFEVDNGTDTYGLRLFHVAGDTLAFAQETLTFLGTDRITPKVLELGPGHLETRIWDEANKDEPTAKVARVFRHLLNHCRAFHFHDTSSTARIKQHCYVGDSRWLMHDAGNLAAVLRRLREERDGTAYQRIVRTIGLIAPFFDDFELELSGPNKETLILNWREKGSDQVFGPHQLSDGTLRAICLVTLLLQPKDELPALIIIDEPELGLHPFALKVVAGLFCMAAKYTQILITTQSSSFLDNFAPDDIVVVERESNGTTFERLDPQVLAAWLEDYSLGEVWEKNVIGGGPH